MWLLRVGSLKGTESSNEVKTLKTLPSFREEAVEVPALRQKAMTQDEYVLGVWWSVDIGCGKLWLTSNSSWTRIKVAWPEGWWRLGHRRVENGWSGGCRTPLEPCSMETNPSPWMPADTRWTRSSGQSGFAEHYNTRMGTLPSRASGERDLDNQLRCPWHLPCLPCLGRWLLVHVGGPGGYGA